MNEITFLDKSTKQGACSECVSSLSHLNHELLPLHTTVSEVREVMMNLEVNMLELLRERTSLLSENKHKNQIIDSDL
jgi:hypothetical protein